MLNAFKQFFERAVIGNSVASLTKWGKLTPQIGIRISYVGANGLRLFQNSHVERIQTVFRARGHRQFCGVPDEMGQAHASTSNSPDAAGCVPPCGAPCRPTPEVLCRTIA